MKTSSNISQGLAITILLYIAIWIALSKIPLPYFLEGIWDSPVPIVLFSTLFIALPILLARILSKVSILKKYTFLGTIIISLALNYVFMNTRLDTIENEIDSFKGETIGIVSELRVRNRQRKSLEHLLRADYTIDGVKYLSIEFEDEYKSLEIGDSVTVEYATTNPKFNRVLIIH